MAELRYSMERKWSNAEKRRHFTCPGQTFPARTKTIDARRQASNNAKSPYSGRILQRVR